MSRFEEPECGGRRGWCHRTSRSSGASGSPAGQHDASSPAAPPAASSDYRNADTRTAIPTCVYPSTRCFGVLCQPGSPAQTAWLPPSIVVRWGNRALSAVGSPADYESPVALRLRLATDLPLSKRPHGGLTRVYPNSLTAASHFHHFSIAQCAGCRMI
jgi:hypothetical protein